MRVAGPTVATILVRRGKVSDRILIEGTFEQEDLCLGSKAKAYTVSLTLSSYTTGAILREQTRRSRIEHFPFLASAGNATHQAPASPKKTRAAY
ncbi:hypothetical protein [Oscillatoria salina]|uniref:hypothetical protein n=1 Tax=Oscillatoria salina TaxID=331517 RepID=UPI0013B9DD33|nr:hypothetical protein [Oscillatoria salina]MBZ8182670.1 hypothetical protein [Oscillatoria salina IIICB1]NET89816.1 hypothetical protein [Kamptonema sp. SIO1D9]